MGSISVLQVLLVVLILPLAIAWLILPFIALSIKRRVEAIDNKLGQLKRTDIQ